MPVKFTNMLKISLLLLLCAISSSGAYKILGVLPFCARSHHNSAGSVFKGLADAGHDVTIISCFKDKYKPKSSNGSYQEVILTGLLEKQQKMLEEMNIFEYEDVNVVSQLHDILDLGTMTTKQFFEHPNVQQLINSNQTYDATIFDEFVFDAVKGLSTHFNAHQILIVSIPSNTWVNHLVGNPSLPSYAPELILRYPDRMNFWQRLSNTLFFAYFKLVHNFRYYPQQEELMKKYIPNAPDFYEVLYNVSFLFYDRHPSVTPAESNVPNMLGVAGMHIKGPEELPKHLKEYLDNSINGVVYVSFGSIAKSSKLPIEKRNMILRSLGSLKENVLLKWEDDILPEKPKNVRMEKWLAQESILAHPNVKLFVTHGGYLSTIETVYYGVPIVGIPIFYDQKINARKCEMYGYGKQIPFDELSEDKLTAYMKEVLGNSKYKENAKYRSAILRDRQTSPLQDTTYWVEYVIRHNGAKHLRVSSLDLAWYQYYLLDVFSFVIVVLVLILFIIKQVFLCIWCSRRSKQFSKKHKLS